LEQGAVAEDPAFALFRPVREAMTEVTPDYVATCHERLLDIVHRPTGVSHKRVLDWFGRSSSVLDELRVFFAHGEMAGADLRAGQPARGWDGLVKDLRVRVPELVRPITTIRGYYESLEEWFSTAAFQPAWETDAERDGRELKIPVLDGTQRYSVWTARGVRAHALTRQYLAIIGHLPAVSPRPVPPAKAAV
jgi:hypothetical protein